MRRALALAAAVTVLVALAPPAGAQDGDARRVVIVSLPTLTWADVEAHQPPALMEVLGASAVASLSVRTIGPTTTLAEGYVTMGAGNRATVGPGEGGFALSAASTIEGATAAAVYERRTGVTAAGSVLHLAIAEVRRRADRLRYSAEPGALGQAVEEAGGTTAVIAASDLGDPAVIGPNRPAAMGVMDLDGQVDGGVVGAQLEVPDLAAPFGYRMDLAATEVALESALAEHDVVLVEASDLVRADEYTSQSTTRAQRLARAAAVTAADELVRAADRLLDPERDLLLLVAPSAPGDRGRLTMFAARGPGFDPGLARSATTRRDGYVTIPDIAPTVLDALEIEVPDAITGTAITSGGGDAPDLGTIASLVDDDEITRFRDRAVGPVSVVFIVLQVLGYAAAAVAVARNRRRLATVAAGTALVTMAVPSVAFLSGLVRYDQLGGMVGYHLVLFAAAAAVAAVAWLLTRRIPIGPPLALAALALVIQLGDIATGANLQINTPFGYSPVVAGRFAGFGNLAFGLTAMAALVVGTGLWAVRSRDAAPPTPRAVVLAAAALFFVTIVFDGLPSFGSDVGGVLATVPTFVVALALMAGWRVTWRRFVLITGVAVAVVAGFAAVDLFRDEDQRTHLGRFAERLFDGDAGDTLIRKGETNLNILMSSVWTWLVPFALAFLAFLTWRGTGPLRTLQTRVPGLRACLVAAIALGALGMAVNDSGVAVPAMMFGILLPYLAWLAIGQMQQAEPAEP